VEHLGHSETLKRRKEVKLFKYKIPQDGQGWYAFSAHGQRALVFVRAAERLAVSVTPEQSRYAPGSRARLKIQTRLGQRGAQAAVGLVGVDDSLSQLVKLPGADALRVVRPEVKMQSKAFGVLDGQALSLGRVRGRFAAEATVLRVASVPRPADLDVVLSGSAQTTLDANAVVTDHFYVVLAELHRQVRSWERSAPATEQMKPETLAKLWNKALDACAAHKKPVKDAFGRRLRLHRLPRDLLALTDPRQVVTVGTRLPEDTENWPRWVARRKP
jgi:hypothetical protein